MASSNVIQSVVKKDKVKKGKDPNKPKRPQSAYNLFYQDKAQIYKEQNPHVPQKDIMSIIGPTWKDCVGEEKAQYERRALALKQEFELKLAQYNASLAGGGYQHNRARALITTFTIAKMRTKTVTTKEVRRRRRSSVEFIVVLSYIHKNQYMLYNVYPTYITKSRYPSQYHCRFLSHLALPQPLVASK